MDEMDRRGFMKAAAATAAAALFLRGGSLLRNDEVEALSLAPERTEGFYSAGAVAGTLAAPAVPIAATFLASLVSGILSGVVSEQINKWIDRLGRGDRALVMGINDMMAQHRYTDYRWGNVYRAGNKHLYGVVNEDGHNVCAAVYQRGFFGLRGPVLLEAPAIIGLARMAQHWASNRITPASGLLPVSVKQGRCPALEESMAYPFEFYTDAGWAGVMYQRKPGYQKGSLELISVKGRSDELTRDNVLYYEQYYDVDWV